jgi:Zn-dependent membrane protease YugP
LQRNLLVPIKCWKCLNRALSIFWGKVLFQLVQLPRERDALSIFWRRVLFQLVQLARGRDALSSFWRRVLFQLEQLARERDASRHAHAVTNGDEKAEVPALSYMTSIPVSSHPKAVLCRKCYEAE